MSIRIPAILSIIAAMALPIPQAHAQDFLRWKFRRGEEIKYNAQQNMETITASGANQTSRAMKQSMDMTWQVLDVAAGGDAVMNQIVKRIQVKMPGEDNTEVTLDTSNPKQTENPFLNSMGEVFGKIVNQSFKISMKPTGEVGNVEVPKALMEALQASAAGNAGALNEDTLKQMMKQSAVTLPTEKVGPNSTWTSTQSVQFPFGIMNIKSTMTFVKVDNEGNAIINILPEVSVTPSEGAPVKMTLTSSQGQGRVTFNISEGRVSRSQLDLQMALRVDTGQGVLEQIIKQQTALVLVE